MVEQFKLIHQPCELSGMYDLDNNFGMMNWQLPDRKYLEKFDCWSFSRMFDHYNHYMWAMWGKTVSWHSSENNSITFSKEKVDIDINMDSDNGYVENIKLFIEDKDTFEQFLGIFKDQNLSIKYCKSYRIWNKIPDMSKASGIEIEINAPKTPEKRRELIKKVKEHYKNQVYVETEAHQDFPLEYTSNVVNIDEIEKTYDIVEFLTANGAEIGEFSNIHVHVSAKYFGKTTEEIIENLHKILILDYYHGKKEPYIGNVTGTFFFTDDMCKKYRVDIQNKNAVKNLHEKFHDKDSSTKEDIYPRIDYFKWLRDPDNYHSIEFKWCLLKDRQKFEDSIKLLRKYLNIINFDKKEVLDKCKKGDFVSLGIE